MVCNAAGCGRLPVVQFASWLALEPVPFVPELLLYSRGQERQAAIGLELADTLYQMTIAVEAGLGFESAMSRAGKNGKGPLAEFFRSWQPPTVQSSRRVDPWSAAAFAALIDAAPPALQDGVPLPPMSQSTPTDMIDSRTSSW